MTNLYTPIKNPYDQREKEKLFLRKDRTNTAPIRAHCQGKKKERTKKKRNFQERMGFFFFFAPNRARPFSFPFNRFIRMIRCHVAVKLLTSLQSHRDHGDGED